jgi:hypothetical protein
MNLRPPTTVALAAAALLVSGGIAYAAVQSVDATPDRHVVVPAAVDVSPSADRHGDDDPATHDVNDDHGGLSGRGGDDDPATHDVNDDHGGLSGSDDGGSDDSGSDDSGGHGSDD